MPWEHCGELRPDSLAACPACGAGKATWTLRMDRTRSFIIGQAEHDEEAQVEALEGAAEEATPFCEKCASEPPAPEPEPGGSGALQDEEPPPPPQVEQLQVLALQDAAAQGAPFCEKCGA